MADILITLAHNIIIQQWYAIHGPPEFCRWPANIFGHKTCASLPH